MSFELISSKSNDKIKRVALLVRSSNARKEQGLFVLEGLRLCRDAMKSNVGILELYFTEAALNRSADDVNALISFADHSYLVSPEAFLKISDTDNSQGIVAVLSFKSLGSVPEISNCGRYIACENVADPSNLGAIARTAEALGLSGMLLIGHCCDHYNAKALRASMGALLRLNLYNFENAQTASVTLRNKGMRLIASVVHGDACKITDVEFKNGDVIVIGNEANGMTDELVELCDMSVTIPINGRSESFNAAAAAAILMWELSRK